MNKLDDGIRKKALTGVIILGIAAIVTVGVLSTGRKGTEETPDPLVDLNTPDQSDFVDGNDGNTDVAVNPPTVTVSPDGDGTGQKADGSEEGDNLPGTDPGDGQDKTQVADGEGDGKGQPEADPVQSADASGQQNPDDSNEEIQEVLSPQVIAESLTYQKESGLLWPLQGEVIIPYSPDHGVFHYTLEQFRTSNSVVLSSEVGTPVFAAAKGVVVSITDNVRTGKTVKLALGNDTYLVYGQLALDGLKEGDIIEEGDCIGAVAAPTRYYVIEGPNLYFQVLEGEETINPMLLLRGDTSAE